MTTLAERLTLAIEHAQLTKAELARRVGISAPSVNGWFSGKAKFLRGENLLAAAKALGVNETWLATGKGRKRVVSGKGVVGRVDCGGGSVSKYVGL